jgi:hypothetical protein
VDNLSNTILSAFFSIFAAFCQPLAQEVGGIAGISRAWRSPRVSVGYRASSPQQKTSVDLGSFVKEWFRLAYKLNFDHARFLGRFWL